jgi:hypothetical protein
LKRLVYTGTLSTWFGYSYLPSSIWSNFKLILYGKRR